MLELDLNRPAPQPQSLAEAQQMIDVVWQALGEALGRIEKLEEQLNTDSNHSSKPPSSDSAKQRAERRRRPRSERARGAQPGHPKHERTRVSEVDGDDIQRFFPADCVACGGPLWLRAEPVVRHHVFDLPQVRYPVTEYQLYAGDCPHCQQHTIARLPDWVPSGQMGPGLGSWIGVLSGQFHLAICPIQQFLQEQWQLGFSSGAIRQAPGKIIPWLAPLYQQIGAYVRHAEVAHADETTHERGTERRWRWCLGTTLAVYFLTHYSRGKAAALAVLGHFSGVLVSDHYAGYHDYARHCRQLCWAHLIRRLEPIAQRSGQAGTVGQPLVVIARTVLRTQQRWPQGALPPSRYYRRMQRLRTALRAALERGQGCGTSTRTANQCRHLLNDEALDWTFLSDPCIPLTNTLAERALRPYVSWRKLSFASQS